MQQMAQEYPRNPQETQKLDSDKLAEIAMEAWVHFTLTKLICQSNLSLKPPAGGPGLPSLKCTSAAAPT